MASEPVLDSLRQAHEALLADYRAVLERPAEADRRAHLRIADVVTDVAGVDSSASVTERLDAQSEVSVSHRPLDHLHTVLSEACLAETDDPLGRLYEATRSTGERRTMGQFYTPMPVARAATDWALSGTHEPIRVLDPGTGSGTFLVAAHRTLDAADAAGVLVGVDIEELPLRLARLRLQMLDDPRRVRALNCSFFDLSPSTPPPTHAALDDQKPDGPIGPFDAIVGNPPFVRGDELETGPAQYRSHLADFGPDGETPYLDGDLEISHRSDVYVYFVTQATRFLRDGGRLAFVLPSKWLMSDYGETLQRFLFDHYSIDSVIDLGRAFDDALVDTCLLLAERRTKPAARDSNTVRFVGESETADRSLSRVVDPGSTPNESAVQRRQGDLDPGKLDGHLVAPDWLLDLAGHDSMITLDEVAAVSRGVMTGANRCFFVDRDDRDRWKIDSRFLRPAVKSLRDIERPDVGHTDIDRWLLDVHDYVTALPDDRPSAATVKAALESDGYDGLLGYIEHAETNEWHTGRTCASRPVWFDLGRLPTPDAFVPKLLRERVFVIRNTAKATPSNAIDCLETIEDSTLILALLNTSLTQAFMELRGRDEAGMLQLMTYETAGLPIPDPQRFDEGAREAITNAYERFRTGASDREPLDRVVHDVLDLDLELERVQTTAARLRQTRLDG